MLAGAKHIQSWLKKRIGDTMSKSDKLKFLISLGLVLKYSVEGADLRGKCCSTLLRLL